MNVSTQNCQKRKRRKETAEEENKAAANFKTGRFDNMDSAVIICSNEKKLTLLMMTAESMF